MTEPQRPTLTVNARILQRVFDEVHRTPNLEIGGRFFGQISEASVVVDDFIPTGPEPDNVSAVELLPDRRYQLWTLDQLRAMDEDLQLFGSWHSHIPNGLERFSRQDFRAYHGRMQPPYPYNGMLCGLIVAMPECVDDVKDNLMLAWFPAGEELGVHSFYEADEVNWVEKDLDAAMVDLIQLTNHDAYQSATGRVPLSLEDWHRAIDHIGGLSVDPNHEIRQSPDGERLLIVETEAGDEGYALELSSDGAARCYFDEEEPTDWTSVSLASASFEDRLHDWYDLPTEWSHLNRTLASLLKSEAEKPPVIEEIGQATPVAKKTIRSKIASFFGR